MINAFVFFNDYKNYTVELFKIIKENGLLNIEEIIHKIITDIVTIYQK